MPLSLIIALIHLTLVPLCLASPNLTAPPNILLISYPTVGVTLDNLGNPGQPPELGIGLDIPTYHGLARTYSLSLVFPNNTEALLGRASDFGRGTRALCTGGPNHGVDRGDGHTLDFEARFRSDVAGNHTMVWNVTYATYRDSNAINQTIILCDASQLSNQTWSFRQPLEVLPAQEQKTTAIAYNMTRVTLTPEPTGKILVNGSLGGTGINGTSGQNTTSGGGAAGDNNGGLAAARWSVETFVFTCVCTVVILLTS